MQHRLSWNSAWLVLALLMAVGEPGAAQTPPAPQPQPRGDVPVFGPQPAPQTPAPRAQQPPPRPQQPPRQQQQQQQQQQPPQPQQTQQTQQPPAQQQGQQQLVEPTPQPIRNEPFDLPPAGTMVVVVDLASLQANSNAGQMIRYRIERERNQVAADSQREETQLQTQRQEIERQPPGEPRNNRIREFQRRVQQYESQFGARRQQLEQVFGEAVNQFQRAVGDIIGEIVQEKQYLIVMNREAIIGFNTSLDITPEVMRRLNIRLPQVPIVIPPPPPPPTR